MKQTTLFIFSILLVTATSHTNQPVLLMQKDISKVTGCWKGNLEYADYKSGKPVEIPAEMRIKKLSTNIFILRTSYPAEPHQNATDTFRILSGGTMLNQKKVIERINSENGVTIMTEYTGKDGNDNKPAIIRHIYTFSNKELVMEKKVQFTGSDRWITRNKYRFLRKRC